MKGSDRNKPCACGSGLKAKRCDCRERALSARLDSARAEYRAIRERSARRPIAHTRSQLLVAALAAIAAGGPR